MSSVAEGVRLQETSSRFGDELYGLDALRRARNHEEWLAALAMIDEQEARHILEGLRLVQWDSQDFFVKEGFLIDPYSGLPQVDTCQNAIDVAEDEPLDLTERLGHDKRTAIEADRLMRQGEIGQGFWRLLPYAYELDERAARNIGMWPEERRSYLHFYRKTGPARLEFTVINIDHAELSWHRILLEEATATTMQNKASYELGGIFVPVEGMTTATKRDCYLLSLLDRSSSLADQLSQAQEFVTAHREDIGTITRLYADLAQSEREGKLNEGAREALGETLKLAQQLGQPEQWNLLELAGDSKFDPLRYDAALRLMVNVRRYGVWHYLNMVVGGDAVEHPLGLGDISMYARRAAWSGNAMPGCPGGFGMEWHGGETHIGPCGGPCRRKAIVVGIGSWCHECITGPKGC